MIFGPRKREYNLAMNRKERQLALRTALQSRVEDLIVVEDFQEQLNPPKTRAVAQALLRWGVMEDQSALLIVAERSQAVERAVRNIARVKLIGLDQINVFDLLNVDWVLITTSALEQLKARWGSGAATEAVTQAEAAEGQAQPEDPKAQADQADQEVAPATLQEPTDQAVAEEELQEQDSAQPPAVEEAETAAAEEEDDD